MDDERWRIKGEVGLGLGIGLGLVKEAQRPRGSVDQEVQWVGT
jgi:hypothetical protein